MAATNGARTTPPAGSVASQGRLVGRLIGGVYAVDPSASMPGAGGGLAAIAATRAGDSRPLMAVESPADAPPRPQAINALAGVAIPGLLPPLAVGPATGPEGRNAMFVVCPQPPGPALSAALESAATSGANAAPWTEQELLQALLRPVAAALARLAALSVTHRAVRVDNLFRAGPREQVTLGCAWASPPALLQPAVYEPPYVAICPPAGRGEGSIADDVYALGVTMLILALGRVPLAGLDEAEIVRRKIDQGSFRALAGRERLPPMIADLVSGMLAEDPEHRPPPALLADPAAARSRRVAARPHRRAQRPLELGGHEVWHARGLAHALTTEAAGGAKALRSGAVEIWLRRGLGEAPLAARIEEIVRQRLIDAAGDDARADAMLMMRAVSVLDPLAPLCWEGVCLWPDGIGPLLAGIPMADSEPMAGRMTRLIGSESAGTWVAARPERPGAAALRLDIRQDRAKLLRPGWAGGLARLRFTLNPLLPCRSRLLGGAVVARLADLLPALEAAARPDLHAQLPIDREIAAYIAARDDLRVEGLVAALGAGDNGAMAALRLLASLQQRLAGQPAPRLAAWLAHHLADSARSWRNRARREACVAALEAAVAAGRLDHMHALLDDEAARRADAAGAAAAAAAARGIDAELEAIAAASAERAETARRLGCEVAGALGMAALGAMAIAAVAG
jgi:hypothetical protein